MTQKSCIKKRWANESMELSTQNHMLQNFKLQVNILVQVTLSEAIKKSETLGLRLALFPQLFIYPLTFVLSIKKSPQIQFPSRSLDK